MDGLASLICNYLFPDTKYAALLSHFKLTAQRHLRNTDPLTAHVQLKVRSKLEIGELHLMAIVYMWPPAVCVGRY